MTKLWEKIVKVSERATQIGAIEKIESSPLFIKENGVNFIVSVAKSLSKRPFNFQKPEITSNSNNCNTDDQNTQQQPTTITTSKKFIDPFLPYDKDLFVSELFGTHNLILNKFNVSNYHSIIATVDYQEQIDPLNKFDFNAIWECIKSTNMLCFFNCGPNSGASQPHKHVQLLVTPFTTSDNDQEELLSCPMESLIKQYKNHKSVFEVEQLPFKNAAINIQFDDKDHKDNSNSSLISYLESQYLSLLNTFNLYNNNSENNSIDSNNNIVDYFPRSNYQSKGISINSVGFTGAVLVRKEEELETLKSYGIMNILKDDQIQKRVELPPLVSNDAQRFSHPVQSIQLDNGRTETLLRNFGTNMVFGQQMTINLEIEKQIFSKFKRLPTLPSSMLALETVLGLDEDIDYEDYLNDPLTSEQMPQPLHSTMENRLGLVGPKHII
eukprot:gene5680-7070_t